MLKLFSLGNYAQWRTALWSVWPKKAAAGDGKAYLDGALGVLRALPLAPELRQQIALRVIRERASVQSTIGLVK
jgi:hypothetical protein